TKASYTSEIIVATAELLAAVKVMIAEIPLPRKRPPEHSHLGRRYLSPATPLPNKRPPGIAPARPCPQTQLSGYATQRLRRRAPGEWPLRCFKTNGAARQTVAADGSVRW